MVYGRALPGHTAGSHVYDQALYDLASETTYHRMFAPQLVAKLTASPADGARVYGGDIVTYTIEVANTGEMDAVNVLIRDAIPGGLSLVSGSSRTDAPGAVFKQYGNLATWIVPQLRIGEKRTLSFQARVGDMPGIGSRTLRGSAEVTEAGPTADPAKEMLTNPRFRRTNWVQHIQSMGATIVVHKVDGSNGDPLAAAEFTLRALKVAVPELAFDEWSATTDDQGEAVFDDVPIGQYEVIEIQAPEGYIRSLIRRSINVDGSQSVREVTISNTRGQEIQIMDQMTPNASFGSRTEGDSPQ
jgi:uncharacterized repeat protein (TIGR01451 family)